jgi:hypothetical protein
MIEKLEVKAKASRLFYEELRARRHTGSALQSRTFSVSVVHGDQSSAYRSDRYTSLKIDSAQHLRKKLEEDEQCLQREDTNREIKNSMVKTQEKKTKIKITIGRKQKR